MDLHPTPRRRPRRALLPATRPSRITQGMPGALHQGPDSSGRRLAGGAGARLERCRTPIGPVSALLDTSMIVRYLTGDPPDLADASARVIDVESDLLISDVALVETAYVLGSVYDVPQETLVDHLIVLIRKANIATLRLPKEHVLEALRLCRPSGRVSFADALNLGGGTGGGCDNLHFRRTLPERRRRRPKNGNRSTVDRAHRAEVRRPACTGG